MFNSLVPSFVLSQVFGAYILIIAIVMLCRADYYRQLLNHLEPNNAAITLGAAIGLLFGLVLVDVHNIWVLAPRVIVTMICWLIVIKSLFWLIMPEKMLIWSRKVYLGKGYYAIVFFMTVFAVTLIFRGFYLFHVHQVLAISNNF